MKWSHGKLVVLLLVVVLSTSACGMFGCGGNASNNASFGGCSMRSTF
jgi:hypothetical protein